MADTDAPEPEEVQNEQFDDQAPADQAPEDPQTQEPSAEDAPTEDQPAVEYHHEGHEEFVDALRFEQIHGDSAIGDKMVDRFDDVPLKVAIELGRVNLEIRDILDLKEGSIIETRKLSGQPMEIMVNERLFGRGEVVVVGDNLAIRITDLKKPDLG